MTYRLDSDLPRPYGWLSAAGGGRDPVIRWQPVIPTPQHIMERVLRQPKTKMVAWMASNCNTHSNRQGKGGGEQILL